MPVKQPLETISVDNSKIIAPDSLAHWDKRNPRQVASQSGIGGERAEAVLLDVSSYRNQPLWNW
jgi:hypothetical protein